MRNDTWQEPLLTEKNVEAFKNRLHRGSIVRVPFRDDNGGLTGHGKAVVKHIYPNLIETDLGTFQTSELCLIDLGGCGFV